MADRSGCETAWWGDHLKLHSAQLAAACAVFFAIAPGAQAAGEARDLTQLSLEELSTIEVTSVSRKAEPLADAAAAISVITSETLRQSGARTIPEALRLVPGLHVAQVTSSAWGVSARGFSSTNSAKLLVLSDTRSIYTPLFSGVFWYAQDLLLEDVDRIEVIRGPGASLWGANAVNGVVNITSKSAKETQGAYFEAGTGSTERGFGAVRYGGQLAENLWFRVFAQGFDRTGEYGPPTPASDNWKMGHFGFRSDWQPSAGNTLTVQGDAYTGDVGEVRPSIIVGARPGPSSNVLFLAGGNVLARWTHELSSSSELQIRAYYDATHHDDPSFLDDLDTADVEVQHRFRLPLNQEVLWGLNYRSMNDRTRGKGVFALNPPDSWDNLYSGFVQDQIAVLDSLTITLGTKVEHNDFSGWELQPTARVSWIPFPGQALWAAASRAVRMPTRLERDINIDVTDPAGNPVLRLVGNRAYGSEKLFAYELGYRLQIAHAFFVDLAAYYNIYKGLSSLELNPVFVDPQTGQTVVPLVDKNLTDGTAKGGEASVTLAPMRPLRLVANYTYVLLALDPKGRDLNRGFLYARATPRNQVGLQSLVTLPAHVELDAFFRYLSAVPASAELVAGQETPAYATVDLRAAWRFRQLELSVVGRNLAQSHHREFPGGTEMRRSGYVKLAGRF